MTLPGSAALSDEEPKADLVIRSAQVVTMDPARPLARAVALRRNLIVYVGEDAGVEPLIGKGTRVISCGGPASGTPEKPEAATAAAASPGPGPGSSERPAAGGGPCVVLPGLIDAHAHLLELGLALQRVELRGMSSVAEVAQAVRARASRLGPEHWVLGQSWDQNRFSPPELPTTAARRTLDAAAGGRPVWLSRVDGHAGWASTEALRRAGITKSTPEVPGGRIVRDESGEPTGVLIDRAMALVDRVVPSPNHDQLEEAILAAATHVTARGLTAVHEMGMSAEVAEVYRRLADDGKLPLRIYGFLSDPMPPQLAQYPESLPYKEQLDRLGERLGTVDTGTQHQRMFALRGIKLFMDGALGSRGAALDQPYSDEPQGSGLLLTTPEHVTAMARWALLHGYQLATHAIGDRANHLVLDAYEQAGVRAERNVRFRIEHAQVILPSDLRRRRFEELGVIASVQPTHATSDMPWAPARLGPQRTATAYAWQDLLKSGARIAAGSDFPVEEADPRLGLHAAVTRQDLSGQPPGGFLPSQRLSLGEAIRAFTTDAAYAGFAENYLGRVQAGFAADLTVLDGTLDLSPDLAPPPRDLAQRAVLLTVVDGRLVHVHPDARTSGVTTSAASDAAGRKRAARSPGAAKTAKTAKAPRGGAQL